MAKHEEKQTGKPAENKKRDSGRPGGGEGRTDNVGYTPVYPGTMDPDKVPDDAEIRWSGEFGQKDRGPEGYNDSGSSEVMPPDRFESQERKEQQTRQPSENKPR